MIISKGTYVNSTQPLGSVPMEEVVKAIQRPDNNITMLIENIRNSPALNKKACAQLKLRLPFFCCTTFKEGIRRLTHVDQILGMVIDIDMKGENCNKVKPLKQVLCKDPQVMVAFISPGNQGLKLIYKFENYLTHTKQYSDFYKLFVSRLETTYNIQGQIDRSTSDPTRACFYSYDPEIYYNPNALCLVCEKESIPEELMPYDEPTPLNPETMVHSTTIVEIRGILNPLTKRPAQNYFVPLALENQVPLIKEALENSGITVQEIKDINYGKKFLVSLINQVADVNIYYGKRGFSVIKTPKAGTSLKLAQQVEEIVLKYFYT